ncbi:MAG: hypothetical protein A2Y07_02180 [Planctomycetes bacterium GWF2_50_10]|nr:MAG: hypothetical protein A2Y07_02180 [Planctomycetes bacterium GWF2_50_10]
MKINVVIFDLDGTITEPILDFDQIRKEIGFGPHAGTILEEMEHMTELEKKRAFAIIDAHETAAVEKSRLNAGVRETLDYLAVKKIQTGIITRNTKENALAVAAKHSLNFDHIVDRFDGPVKPDAWGVLRLCEIFNTPPEQVIVVGDFLHDVQAARAAGAVSVLLKNHKNAHDFLPWSDYSIDRIDELISLIQKLYSRKV